MYIQTKKPKKYICGNSWLLSHVIASWSRSITVSAKWTVAFVNRVNATVDLKHASFYTNDLFVIKGMFHTSLSPLGWFDQDKNWRVDHHWSPMVPCILWARGLKLQVRGLPNEPRTPPKTGPHLNVDDLNFETWNLNHYNINTVVLMQQTVVLGG